MSIALPLLLLSTTMQKQDLHNNIHNNTPVVIMPVVGCPMSRTHVVPAGRSFHRRRHNLARGRRQDSTEDEQHSKEHSTQNVVEIQALLDYRTSIAHRTFTDLSYYEQLGLVPYDVSNEDVRTAYRRVLIEHHPDKTGKTENDPNYLSVQRAFVTLMDVKLKRAYDSQCDCDDTIPTGKERIRQHVVAADTDDQEPIKKSVCFYDLYGPVFARNARFSTQRPVPALGTDDLEIHSVQSFYAFWNTFDSWRDFTHNAENDLDTAGGRYEKRDMMKKNEAAAKKQKRKEYQRLANLIDRAMANDPRLLRVKAAEKAAKAKLAQDKEDAQKAAEKAITDAAEAQAHAEAEEMNKKKANSKAAKFAREQQKKVIRKAKKAFREALGSVSPPVTFLDVEEVEFLCDALELEQIQTVTSNLAKGDPVDALVSLWTSLRGPEYADKKKSKC